MNIESIFEKKDELANLWQTHRNGILYILQCLKKAAKHFVPKSGGGSVRVGTGDPYATGQVLGAFAFLYPFFGGGLRVEPDFENRVFKGDLRLCGNIQLWHVLKFVIQILKNENSRRLLRELKDRNLKNGSRRT